MNDIARVFISSTYYDLVDVRAELRQCILELGLHPVNFETPDSNFEVVHDRGSIANCLVNLRRSDVCVVVLSARYGPTLEKLGYQAISATHLEYQTAVEAGIPVWLYARTTTEAEYFGWRADKDFPTRWVSRENHGIFALLTEHSDSSEGKDDARWRNEPFRDSIELKQMVARRLERAANRVTLERLLRSGTLPRLAARLELHAASAIVVLTNVGPGAVTDLHLATSLTNGETTTHKISVDQTFIWTAPLLQSNSRIAPVSVTAEYTVPHGYRLQERLVFQPGRSEAVGPVQKLWVVQRQLSIVDGDAVMLG